MLWRRLREGRGWVRCFPRSENPDLHPTDDDLSVGTPDLGHPCSCKAECEGRLSATLNHARAGAATFLLIAARGDGMHLLAHARLIDGQLQDEVDQVDR